MDDPISIDCPMRGYNALARNGIRICDQLLQLTDWELTGMRGFGEKSLADRKAHLAARSGGANRAANTGPLLAPLAELNKWARMRLSA